MNFIYSIYIYILKKTNIEVILDPKHNKVFFLHMWLFGNKMQYLC